MKDKVILTLEAYLNSVQGRQAWIRGRALYEKDLSMANRAPDGLYQVILREVRFENPNKGLPTATLPFITKTGLVIEKKISIDTAEGMSEFLFDLKLLGCEITTPAKLTEASSQIADLEPEAEIQLNTTNNTQYIKIFPAIKKDESLFMKKAIAVVEVVPPPIPEPIPESAKIVIEEKVPTTPIDPSPVNISVNGMQEVDIVKGSTLKIRTRDGAKMATVLATLDDTHEIAVQSEGRTLIIKDVDVIALLA